MSGLLSGIKLGIASGQPQPSLTSVASPLFAQASAPYGDSI